MKFICFGSQTEEEGREAEVATTYQTRCVGSAFILFKCYKTYVENYLKSFIYLFIYLSHFSLKRSSRGRGTPSPYQRGRRSIRGRPQPIVWQDGKLKFYSLYQGFISSSVE